MAITNSSTLQHHPDLAENMKRIVHILMAVKQLKAAEMCNLMHVSNGTWYSRMADGKWTAPQLLDLATVLDTSIETLFGDPDELFRSR